MDQPPDCPDCPARARRFQRGRGPSANARLDPLMPNRLPSVGVRRSSQRDPQWGGPETSKVRSEEVTPSTAVGQVRHPGLERPPKPPAGGGGNA